MWQWIDGVPLAIAAVLEEKVLGDRSSAKVMYEKLLIFILSGRDVLYLHVYAKLREENKREVMSAQICKEFFSFSFILLLTTFQLF